MGTFEFIIALLTLLSAQIAAYLKNKSDRAKEKADLDKRQNEEIEAGKIEHQNLFNKIANIEAVLYAFLADYKFKTDLKNQLEIKSDQIIRANQDLDKNITTLLQSGRDAAIKFANFIYFTKIQLTETSLKTESDHIFDSLKMVANAYFTETKNEKTFAKYIRHNTDLKQVAYSLMIKIIDIKSGKYNGQTPEKLITCFADFMEKSYLIGIQAWREWNRL